VPTSADAKADALVDTSVGVALLVGDHEAHADTLAVTRGRSLGLAGHAWFETYSVVTRLPGAIRRRPDDVGRLLAHDFPGSRFLDVPAQRRLIEALPPLGIAGGAVYDALVGATAVHHRLRLLTRDRRALDVYRQLGVDVELLG
jgi:predicted nucleic acid-binding protein